MVYYHSTVVNAHTHLSVMCRTAWFRWGTVCRSWIGLFWWAAGPHRPARVPSPSEPRDPRWSPGNGRDTGGREQGEGWRLLLAPLTDQPTRHTRDTSARTVNRIPPWCSTRMNGNIQIPLPYTVSNRDDVSARRICTDAAESGFSACASLIHALLHTR